MNEKRRKMERLTPPEKEERSNERRAAIALKDRVKAAEQGIRRIRERYPDMPLIKILVRFREAGALAEWIMILRIEKNQAGRLLPDDLIFLEEQKNILRQRQPQAEREAREYFYGKP